MIATVGDTIFFLPKASIMDTTAYGVQHNRKQEIIRKNITATFFSYRKIFMIWTVWRSWMERIYKKQEKKTQSQGFKWLKGRWFGSNFGGVMHRCQHFSFWPLFSHHKMYFPFKWLTLWCVLFVLHQYAASATAIRFPFKNREFNWDVSLQCNRADGFYVK